MSGSIVVNGPVSAVRGTDGTDGATAALGEAPAAAPAMASRPAVKDKPATRERSRIDRFMRRLLRVEGRDPKAIMGAHHTFRLAIVISGIRCLITYLLVPILVPILSFANAVAAPLGIALGLFALVNGVISVRRFWLADRKGKWMYTAFIAVVFVVLAFALATDVGRLLS